MTLSNAEALLAELELVGGSINGGGEPGAGMPVGTVGRSMVTVAADYPDWVYYPNRTEPPTWALELVGLVRDRRAEIDSSKMSGLTSDRVLSVLAPPMAALGYSVETGKKAAERIRRPVLFGDQGRPRVTYEVDAFHDELGVVVEIEAGRGARGNAVYRDLVRSSLIVDVRFLVLGVMREYHHKSSGKPVVVRSYHDTREQLDAVYASGKLRLPFEGVLLFGY